MSYTHPLYSLDGHEFKTPSRRDIFWCRLKTGSKESIRHTMLMLREASSRMQRHLGVLFAIGACTSFTLQDIFIQYIQVIDPIDTVSLMLLRVVGPLIICYTYLYCISQPYFFLGPPQFRRIILIRSVLQFFAQLAFFQALRHLTSGIFPLRKISVVD